jgi:phosphoribosylamine---glycine ligase
MFILSIDPHGLSLSWCLRCIAAGHTVKMYTLNNQKYECVGLGLVDKVSDWKPYMKVADLIFVSSNMLFLDELVEYKKQGYPIFGTDRRSAKLEFDRMYGQQVIEDFGGETIPSHKFSNYDSAIKFVKEHRGRWVSKPIGQEEDKSLSYVAKDEADMVGFLTKRKTSGKPGSQFILQEFRPGIELCVTGVFGPNGWQSYWFEGFEFKKHMNGDLGVNTGEMGTVIRAVKESKLADKLLVPMEPLLKKLQYTGPLDMNVIIDEKNGTPYPMEWTARPGWPYWNIMQSLIVGDPAQWMKDCIDGKDSLVCQEKTALGVVMANSDFPFNKKPLDNYLDFPINTDDADIDNIHPCEVKLCKTVKMIDGELIEDCLEWGTAGTEILVCTGVGDTVSEAKDKAYKVVDNVKFGNDMHYRKDIGDKCEKWLPKLHKLGYSKNWKF